MDEKKCKDICRSFSFVNLNIPPRMKKFSDEKDMFHCEYISVGFFDGMKTELLPPVGNCSILSSMWLYNERLALALDGTHSFQNIFGFRHVADEEDDKKFWSYETDCRYPLTFVTFLQMQPEEGTRTTIEVQQQNIEARLGEEAKRNGGKFIFSCYVTLDKNDFVICIKSKQYRDIANSILALHNNLKPKILYSYSVLSLNRRWLHALTENGVEFPVDGMEDELIDSICLKGIANSVTSGSLADKYRELCLQLDQFLFKDQEQNGHDSHLYDILGDYDFRYIARDVPMKRLLLAIAEENKALNYESDLFRFALFSSSFVLNIRSKGVTTGRLDYLNSADPESLIPPNVSGYASVFETQELSDGVRTLNSKLTAPLCLELMESLQGERADLYKDLQGPSSFSLENTTYWTNMTSLWKILSSLTALENAPTRKYDFHSLYWPYRTLIEILSGENYSCDGKRPDDDLYGFIHGLSATLNGTLRTDIQFFQVNDFNAIVHYAPAKLRAFYSAWTYDLTQCYRHINVTDPEDQEREYEFEIVPNTHSAIRTFGFDPSPDRPNIVGMKRLMRIEIPERYLYQPRETCIHLAHETAHFVGTGMRHRSVRHRQFTAVLSGMIAIQYCTDICNCLVECGRIEMAKLFKRFVNSSQEELCDDICAMLEDAVSTVSKSDGIGDIWENEHIRSEIFRSYAATALQMILERPAYGVDQFKGRKRSERSLVANRIRYLGVTFRLYAKKMWEGDDGEWEASLIDLVRIFDDISGSQYGRVFAQFLQQTGQSNMIQMLMLLIKEAQVDVASILTLRITPSQYFQSFFQSGLTYARKKLGTILRFRIFLVLCAIQEASRRDDIPFLTEKGWDRPLSCPAEDGERSRADEEDDAQWIGAELRTMQEELSASLCVNAAVLPIRAAEVTEEKIPFICNSQYRYFALYSRYVFEKILDYLKKCIDSFAQAFTDDRNGTQSELEEISKVYSRICDEDVLNLVEEIDKTLFDYERKRGRK